MADYRALIVWQKSMDLVVKLYELTREFPQEEQYALTSQMRRAVVSIPSNISEGSRRRGKDQKYFLVIAYGSASELETQLEISRRLRYGKEPIRKQVEALLVEVLRMLNKMTSGY